MYSNAVTKLSMLGLMFVLLLGTLSSCNFAIWNQNRLDNKFERNEIREDFFVTAQDSIHYFEAGKGPTVLLVHGFGGDAQVTWQKTILDLVDEYHIVCPDLLWFGESVSTREANLNAQVAALHELMDVKSKEPFRLAGISYGGFVSIGMVYAKPKRIHSFCMIDSPGVTYDVSLLDTLANQQKVESFVDLFVVTNGAETQRLADLAFYKDKKMPKGILEDAYELYFSRNHRELKLLLTTIQGLQEDFLSQKIKFPPSTVIWGEHDIIFPPSEGRKLAKYIGADFVTIPKAGHAPNLERFKDFEEQFRSFLSGTK